MENVENKIKKTILAGMRVWPTRLHLGTYYGWVKPLKELSENHKVNIVISNVQSIENFKSIKECYSQAEQIKDELKNFIPKATIMLETENSDLNKHTIQAFSLFTNSFYKRLGPFKQDINNNEVSYHKLLYPCMMIANILNTQPTHILAKHSHQLSHIDVINDVITKGIKKFSWPPLKLKVEYKNDIYIPDLKGVKHMRRSDESSALLVHSKMNSNDIMTYLHNVITPQSGPGPISVKNCGIIAPMWLSILNDENCIPIENCISNKISACIECKKALSIVISKELTTL